MLWVVGTAIVFWGVTSAAEVCLPQRSLTLSDLVESQGGDNLTLLTFKIKNEGSFDKKDPVMVCDMAGASGTIIKTQSKTIYEVLPAGLTRKFGPVLMGPLPEQMASFNCRIGGVSIKW